MTIIQNTILDSEDRIGSAIFTRIVHFSRQKTSVQWWDWNSHRSRRNGNQRTKTMTVRCERRHEKPCVSGRTAHDTETGMKQRKREMKRLLFDDSSAVINCKTGRSALESTLWPFVRDLSEVGHSKTASMAWFSQSSSSKIDMGMKFVSENKLNIITHQKVTQCSAWT
jgi:hypothetical protein